MTKLAASVENLPCGKTKACGEVTVGSLRSIPGGRRGHPIRSTCYRASSAPRHARRDPDQVAAAADCHGSRRAYGDYCCDHARLGYGANRDGRPTRGWAVAPKIRQATDRATLREPAAEAGRFGSTRPAGHRSLAGNYSFTDWPCRRTCTLVVGAMRTTCAAKAAAGTSIRSGRWGSPTGHHVPQWTGTARSG